MGASVRRPRRAAKAAAGDLPRYRVPQHWARQLGGTMRQQLEQKMEAGKASVNVSLQRLEHCRMAVRNALPCPRNTKAFEWSAVL